MKPLLTLLLLLQLVCKAAEAAYTAMAVTGKAAAPTSRRFTIVCKDQTFRCRHPRNILAQTFMEHQTAQSEVLSHGLIHDSCAEAMLHSTKVMQRICSSEIWINHGLRGLFQKCIYSKKSHDLLSMQSTAQQGLVAPIFPSSEYNCTFEMMNWKECNYGSDLLLMHAYASVPKRLTSQKAVQENVYQAR